MPEIIEVEFHSKYLSDFQMSRLVQASLRIYTVPITAFISDTVIIEDRCLSALDHEGNPARNISTNSRRPGGICRRPG